MIRYTDLQSMIEAGIIEKNRSPSNCVVLMEREFIEYVVGESATYAYPVLEIFSNPRKAMQGGFIAAAFDNTFGGLVYLATKHIEMATIDLSVNYHKPIFENDQLTITAYLKSPGKTIIHLIGEAFNSKKELIATATTNILLLRKG